MSTPAQPNPTDPPAVPHVGRLDYDTVVKALDWRPGEHYQVAFSGVHTNGRLRTRIRAVDAGPGPIIALGSDELVGDDERWIADRFYFSANPVDPDYLDRRPDRKGRPNRFDITRLAAFMMDLDFKADGVVDQAGAVDLIRTFAERTGGWWPALLVHSGHGWQPTYVIAGGDIVTTGPAAFTCSDAAVLLARVGTLVADIATSLGGLRVDSVFEATRLQRLPGSINGKHIDAPVPVRVLDPVTYGFPSAPPPMDLEILRALLDSEGSAAHTPTTDRHRARGAVLPAAPDAEVSWAWLPDGWTCSYLAPTVAGWPTETPPERNPWLFSNAIRLHCAHRLGCLTEQQWHAAADALITRFRQLLTRPDVSGGARAEAPDEVTGAFERARTYAAAKTHAELIAEFGGHDPTDPFARAAHLPPPWADDGELPAPPPAAPAPLEPPAVDTAPIAAAVDAAVASITAIAVTDMTAPVPSAPPPAPPTGGVPVDDGHTDPDRCWPWTPPAKVFTLARAIVDRDHTWHGHPDGRPRLTLRYVLGDWWRWAPGRGWARFTTVDKPIEAVSLMLRRRLEFAWYQGNKKKTRERLVLSVAQYVELVKAVQTVVASDGPYRGNDLRGWLTTGYTESADDHLVVANGTLNIRTRHWHPHDPDLFDPAGALNLVWPDDGSAPPLPTRWLRFLGEVFPPCAVLPPPPGDPVAVVDVEQQATLDGIAAASESAVGGPPHEVGVEPLGTQADRLQEVFGYLLTPETRAQKIVSFLGLPAGGKGTVLRVLEGLLRDHYVAPTEHDLTGSFGLWSLMNASVAVITDSRTASVTAAASRRFLQLLLSVAGEDKKLVQRKHLPDWHGRLGCRIVVASNLEMNLEDHSGALLRRMLPVKFPRTFTGREDRHLTDILLTELPGILAWALDGRDRLQTNDHRFTATVEGDQVLDAMRSATDEYREFVDLYLEIGDDKEWVVFGEIVTLYAWWAEHVQNIAKNAQLPANHLGGKLREVLAGIREGFVPTEWRPKEHRKNLPRRWRRLRFTDAALAQLEAIRTGLP